ncbi:MAG: hypothetical protein WBA17_07345, partial [Saprospiraceae bacterium]
MNYLTKSFLVIFSIIIIGCGDGTISYDKVEIVENCISLFVSDQYTALNKIDEIGLVRSRHLPINLFSEISSSINPEITMVFVANEDEVIIVGNLHGVDGKLKKFIQSGSRDSYNSGTVEVAHNIIQGENFTMVNHRIDDNNNNRNTY